MLRILNRISLSPFLKFLLFAITYHFAYRYGNSFSQATASPFWFPDSVLLCALLYSQPRNWWLFVSVTFPIRLFASSTASIPLWFVLVTTSIDALKGVITAFVLRYFNKNVFRFETLKEFGLFVLFAVLLIPAASAIAGAAARQALGHSYWETWLQWFLGAATAQLIITPALLYWILRVP